MKITILDIRVFLVVAAVLTAAAFVYRAWGDQRVSPDFVSSRLYKGQSMESVRTALPQGLRYEEYSGPLRYWKVSKAGIGNLFTTQSEVVLEFDDNDRLFHAYAKFSNWGGEKTRAIALSRRE